jgi:hypothetical protein
MKKPGSRRDKYFLRDLHQEIDLYDRKLAYLNNHAEFASIVEREKAEQKLRVERSSLEKTARELAASGVEFEAKDLPRSFRTGALEQDSAQQDMLLTKRS